MRKFIFIAVVLFFTGTSWAQNLPIDFESADHNFSAFGGAQFTRDKDPLSANNNVGHITNTGGDIFEGVFIDVKNGIQQVQMLFKILRMEFPVLLENMMF